MAERRQDTGSSEPGPSNDAWWPSDYGEKFRSLSLGSQEETHSALESPRDAEDDILLSETASQILWSTGMLSEPIPDGFYSVIPVRIKLDVVCVAANLLLAVSSYPLELCFGGLKYSDLYTRFFASICTVMIEHKN